MDKPIKPYQKPPSGMAIPLHPAERKLIMMIREMGYGRLEVKVHRGLPDCADEIRVRVKFTEE